MNTPTKVDAVSFTSAIRKDASSSWLPLEGNGDAAFSNGFGRGEEKCLGLSQLEWMSKKHSSFQKQDVKKRMARSRLQ